MATTKKQSIPILLCGQFPHLGQMVRKGLEPGIQVVDFATPDNVEQKLEMWLSESAQPASEHIQQDHLESFDSARPIQAIVLGGGYDPPLVQKLRKAHVGRSGVRKVPWLGADTERTKRDLADTSEEQYAIKVAARILQLIEKLEGEMKFGGGKDDNLYHY